MGVSSSQIATFDEGCPQALASPATVQQAVLTFQEDGVSDVTEVGIGADLSEFTKIAQQQDFHPQYILPDDLIIEAQNGGVFASDPNNLNGAIAISTERSGEATTPGFVPSSGTNNCNAIYKGNGSTTTAYGLGGYPGFICDLVWAVADSINHAPALNRAALALGIEATGTSIDYSYPTGPANYSGSKVTTGGQDWRAAKYFASCSCFQVEGSAFNPPFP